MAEPRARSSQSCLLISMPTLVDPNFTRTTSLISELSAEGAMGLVLNRPLEVRLSQIAGQEVDRAKAEAVRVFWGGPVQNERGWIVHEEASLAAESLEIEPGLYLSSSMTALTRLLETGAGETAPRYRFYLGYAGWSPGQLEREMSQSSWVTAPLARALLFDPTPATLWERSLSAIGVDPMALAPAPTDTLQ